MTQKFGRNYRLTIDPKDGLPSIVITMPFTIEFWLQRNTLSDLNHLSIDVYNLGVDNRNRLFQDSYDLRLDGGNGETAPGRTLVFEVGYDNLYRVFTGTIFQASSARAGVDIITRIECKSGIYEVAASQTLQTIDSGKTVGDILNFLCGQMNFGGDDPLTIGAIGDRPDVLHRPVTLNGNTYGLLRRYSGNNVYIDNGKIYVLKNNEVIEGQPFVIDESSGILETPRRDDAILTVTCLLEAGVNMSSLVDLKSSIQPEYNGRYKVIGIQHQGTISRAVCGTARSTFTLSAPAKFGPIVQVPEQ